MSHKASTKRCKTVERLVVFDIFADTFPLSFRNWGFLPAVNWQNSIVRVTSRHQHEKSDAEPRYFH